VTSYFPQEYATQRNRGKQTKMSKTLLKNSLNRDNLQTRQTKGTIFITQTETGMLVVLYLSLLKL